MVNRAERLKIQLNKEDANNTDTMKKKKKKFKRKGKQAQVKNREDEWCQRTHPCPQT